MVQDPLALQRPLDRPDGMSGAPVFCVWRSEDWQCHLSFLGMITSARNGRFMIYSARHIRRALDEYIAL
ncbi:hypothetical protein B6S44_19475 [Bosea sp. Tri-44]|nr:hypothetical protein B6S44_19475 [Bosea sp. Tri-44]